jgi:hypothetical protein
MAETTSFFTDGEPDDHLYALPPDYLAAPLYEPGGLEAAPEAAASAPIQEGDDGKGGGRGNG